jgi:hypothetical protein
MWLHQSVSGWGEPGSFGSFSVGGFARPSLYRFLGSFGSGANAQDIGEGPVEVTTNVGFVAWEQVERAVVVGEVGERSGEAGRPASMAQKRACASARGRFRTNSSSKSSDGWNLPTQASRRERRFSG